uniref:Uncharacterized protein n=1 Tax=Rhizophagus irregularis (strain DAOM 181602 / DAOM 197198 / MUCL 43194) TaxID=747089 RepID=U9T253_RHIID
MNAEASPLKEQEGSFYFGGLYDINSGLIRLLHLKLYYNSLGVPNSTVFWGVV